MLMVDPYRGSNLSIREKFEREAELMNLETYLFWYHRLLNTCITAIEWSGLPAEVDTRYLEWVCAFDGSALLFYDEDIGGFAVSQYTGENVLNRYGDPTIRRARAANGKQYGTFDESNSIIIWNNFLKTNEILSLRLFSKRIGELDRAIDVNIRGQKTPKIICCDKKTQLTLENLFNKYDGNIPFIFAAQNLASAGEINVMDTSTPFVANELTILRRQLFADAMTYYGVENANSEKKERLVSDEVISNLGAVEASRNIRLAPRRTAAERANNNALFQFEYQKRGLGKLNIRCDYRFKSADIEKIMKEVLL